MASDQVRLVFSQTGSLDLSLADQMRPRPRPTENLVGAVSCLLETGPDAAADPAVFLLSYDDIGLDRQLRASDTRLQLQGRRFPLLRSSPWSADAYPQLKARSDALTKSSGDCERAGGRLMPACQSGLPAGHRRPQADRRRRRPRLSPVQGMLHATAVSDGRCQLPLDPVFLVYHQNWFRGMMRPIFRFAASNAWPYDLPRTMSASIRGRPARF